MFFRLTSLELGLLIFVVVLGGLITLGILFKEQLKLVFFSSANDRRNSANASCIRSSREAATQRGALRCASRLH